MGVDFYEKQGSTTQQSLKVKHHACCQALHLLDALQPLSILLILHRISIVHTM